MGAETSIEWTDASWTPIRARCWEIQDDGSGKERIGWHCEHVSEGCRNCYAEGINRRLGTGFDFKPGNLRGRPGYSGGGNDRPEVFLDDKMLLAPLRWKRPRKIFVCSMTDLFADFVKDEWIDRVFAVMALCPQHTFQIVTKRAARMKAYMALGGPTLQTLAAVPQVGADVMTANTDWPLPNVWLGVSAERQQEADERIPLLLTTPAAVRFVSLEPLLGAIDLNCVRWPKNRPSFPDTDDISQGRDALRLVEGTKLDWVIVGGESGPNARPMSIQWARELRQQCAAADVPFFFKQWGEWTPARPRPSGDPGRFAFGDYEHDRSAMIEVDAYPRQFTMFGARCVLERVGKKAAGRELDGETHSAMPGRAA